MIDCRTQHGTWRHKPSGRIIQAIKPYNFEIALIDFQCLGKDWRLWYKGISFYDLKGYYTGFRLKQLK